MSKKQLQSMPDVVDIGEAFKLSQSEVISLMNIIRAAKSAKWVTYNGELMFPCPSTLPPSCIHQSQPTFSANIKMLKRLGIVTVVKGYQSPLMFAINMDTIKQQVGEASTA